MTKTMTAPMKKKSEGGGDEENFEDIAKLKQPPKRKLSGTRWLLKFPILLLLLGYFVWFTINYFHHRYPQPRGGIQLPGKHQNSDGGLHRHRHKNDDYTIAPCSKKGEHPRDSQPVFGLSDLTLAEQEAIITESISNNTIAQWSYYFTHGKHLAGTNKSTAEWTRDKWIGYGIPSHLTEYEVYLNYPVSHSLSLTIDGKEGFVAGLEEDVLLEDSTTGAADRIPTFNGYSKSGSVEAEYVYVGMGGKRDYQRLVDLGVDLKGKIALAKYGGTFRGLKVKYAQEHGMIGVLIYSDPGDDGDITEANGYAAYPAGPARNPSSVQRGSVMFLATMSGDPTTPGYPSKPGVDRKDPSGFIPSIPSLPLSFRDALPFLQALDGYGLTAEEVERPGWTGGLNVSYSAGPRPRAVINLENVVDYTYTPVWNSIGIINGTIEDEVIVIGNHRDAWIVGGAADPYSGTAVLVELSKAFGELLKLGWKPKRTIMLASWDAEEYGIVGSTEWVEEFVTWAVPNMVAYVNVDVAVAGPHFHLEAVPELWDLVEDVIQDVPSPKTKGKSIYDEWTAEGRSPRVPGAGSDYGAFIHTNGIAVIDFGFRNGPKDPVYHYHSNYDSYAWMSNWGDKRFTYHSMMAQIIGRTALRISENVLLPYNVTAFAAALKSMLSDLNGEIAAAKMILDLSVLEAAISRFSAAAGDLMAVKEALEPGEWGGEQETIVNERLGKFERGFIGDGLPERAFYKHLIYAPGVETGYAPTTLPGITEAVRVGNVEEATEYVGITAAAINEVAWFFEGK
ncbi:Zn-dependent exopeptidase [Choiromyces venosus 120613-1]|uniref:Zn-dependent exopeptidase n=1 Tax=Choiromyces venosus 120613-1 TaxID=1336337 RepID=A0A3N4K1Q6_9PEZI|nr:Zn-dependent exopeptidase [Choiromyces venosus 120613-1]